MSPVIARSMKVELVAWVASGAAFALSGLFGLGAFIVYDSLHDCMPIGTMGSVLFFACLSALYLAAAIRLVFYAKGFRSLRRSPRPFDQEETFFQRRSFRWLVSVFALSTTLLVGAFVIRSMVAGNTPETPDGHGTEAAGASH